VALLERKYAGALLACALAQKVDGEVARRIRELDELLRRPDLRRLLADPRLGKERRLTLLLRLTGEPEGLFRNFLALVVERRREELLPAICRDFCRLHLESRGTREGELETARPLDPQEVDRLAGALARQLGVKKVLLTVRENPGLMGGIRATIGGRLFDASAAGRLDELRRRLMSLPL